jgi:hypothetical protein
MVSLMALWLPILLAAVFVFIASSIIHMFLPYHKTDFQGLPDEEGFMDAVGKFDVPAGEYFFPHHHGDMDFMKSAEYQAKTAAGPSAFMTVLPKGNPFNMGTQLMTWFLYCLVVSIFAAYISSRAVAAGGDYLQVFRFAGCTAFAAYALSGWLRTIWFHQPVSTSIKNTFDGLVNALLTAGAFGWLWPS